MNCCGPLSRNRGLPPCLLRHQVTFSSTWRGSLFLRPGLEYLFGVVTVPRTRDGLPTKRFGHSTARLR